MDHTQTVFAVHYFSIATVFCLYLMYHVLKNKRLKRIQRISEIHQRQIRHHHELWERIMSGGNFKI